MVGIAQTLLQGRHPGVSLFQGSLRELRRDAAAELAFLARARKHLRGTGWIPVIEKRIAALTRGE